MRALTASELLDVWERGQGQPPVRHALLLLEAACPDEAPEALAALPIGPRDARLLTLRAWTFGPTLESMAVCPACSEKLEFRFSTDDVRATPAAEPPEHLTFRSNGYEIAFRLPNSLDVTEVAEQAGEPSQASLLFDRCLLEARHAGESVAAGALPEAVVTAVIDEMAAADPQAEVYLALSCPACSHAWSCLFDIVSYFWREIDAWADRMLRDIGQLARVYGWREADILAMSAWRRQCYLDLIHG